MALHVDHRDLLPVLCVQRLCVVAVRRSHRRGSGNPQNRGQADSAPHRFDLKRHLLKAAVVGAVLFALYYANWSYGWIKPEELDFYHSR